MRDDDDANECDDTVLSTRKHYLSELIDTVRDITVRVFAISWHI